MDLAFGDKALRYVCESLVKARKALGPEAGATLHARLADLEAATNLADLDWLAIELGASEAVLEFHPGFRLIAKPNEAKPPVLGTAIDWTKVERLLLTKLERT